MSSVTFALECPVCLDTIRNPVVPPCGHLICEPCIGLHISLSSTNPFEAKCPVCRASFPSVLPNPSLIPNKYHLFVSPPLRRIFLGERVDNTVINDLESTIVCLEARIEALKSDNESAKRESRLMLDKAKEDARVALDEAKKESQLAIDKVDADAQLAIHEAKKEARFARSKAKKDSQLAIDEMKINLGLANLSLGECMAENNALRSRVRKSLLARGRTAFNIRSKVSNCNVTSYSKRVESPSNQSFGYFGLANDTLLISSAREALGALSSSPTPQSAASAESVDSTVDSGSTMPGHTTDQVAPGTTSAAEESSVTSNTTILDRSPTPPLLYPSPSTSPTISHRNLLEHISPFPVHAEAL